MAEYKERDTNGVITEILETMSSSVNSSKSIALVAPRPLQSELAVHFAKRVLCLAGTADDGCLSCLSWNDDRHPDLILTGTPDQAPGIEDCRRIWEDISLIPVAGPCRLAVLFGCDRLSLPAANSLLKLTEEPPERGRIVLTMEEDNLIPTLKSRLAVFRYPLQNVPAPAIAPREREAFMTWLASGKTKKPSELLTELSAWIPALVEKQEHQLAARLETARVLAEKGNLSSAMIQDLAHEAFQEGSRFDSVFDDLW